MNNNTQAYTVGKSKEEILEECRLYAESRMSDVDWDRKDHILVGNFYHHYLEHLQKYIPQPVPSQPTIDKELAGRMWSILEQIIYQVNHMEVAAKAKDIEALSNDVVYLRNIISKFFHDKEAFLNSLNLPAQPVSVPQDMFNAWPTRDVLSTLIDAAEYLLYHKNYDGPKHEQILHCVKRAKEIRQKLSVSVNVNLK